MHCSELAQHILGWLGGLASGQGLRAEASWSPAPATSWAGRLCCQAPGGWGAALGLEQWGQPFGRFSAGVRGGVFTGRCITGRWVSKAAQAIRSPGSMRGGVGSLEGHEIMNALGGLVKQRAYMCGCGRLACSVCWAGPWVGTGLSPTEGPGGCPVVRQPCG